MHSYLLDHQGGLKVQRFDSTDMLTIMRIYITILLYFITYIYIYLQAGILEWDPFAFSRRFSQHKDWSPVSSNAGGFFTSWATREAQVSEKEGRELQTPK